MNRGSGYDRDWSPSRSTERGMSQSGSGNLDQWRSEGGWSEDRDRDDRGYGYGGSSSYGGSRLRGEDRESYGSYGYGSTGPSQYGGQGQYGQYGGRYGYGTQRSSSSWSPGRSQVGRQSWDRGDQTYDESWRGRQPSDSSRYDRDSNRGGDDRGLLERAGDWIQEKLGKAPKGYTRSDDRIREEVSEAIWRRGDVDGSNVEIVVKDTEVTLTGSVNDRRAKRTIEEIAEDVLGVTDVHNHIKVRREGELYSDRGTGTSTTGTTGTTSTSTTSTTSKTPRA